MGVTNTKAKKNSEIPLLFERKEGACYKYPYEQVLAEAERKGPKELIKTYRTLAMTDLWFLIYFVLEIEAANHPFVVNQCRRVEAGPETMTLDVWAREHWKSTILTIAETIQYILKYPDRCTGIFAYARPVAKGFLRAIMQTLETNEKLISWFPDVLWKNPRSEAPKWSEDDGIIVKRKNSSRPVSTVEAWGLIEGMPTGKHFERRVYDDIETMDIADSPDMMNKVFGRFEMSDNLGMDGGTERVIGTFYSHIGPIKRIQDKKTIDGDPMYKVRIVPGSHDGTKNGTPVLLSQERWDKLKQSKTFRSQQLCDPTPAGYETLKSEALTPIERRFVPPDCFKFMIIDPAGDKSVQQNAKDAWAMGVMAVQPQIDELGMSKVHIVDLQIKPMELEEAIETAVRMYLHNGIIMQLGVEKVGQSTAEVHIANALREHNRYISVDGGTLKILKPEQRKKETRIENALAWPVNNGRWYYCTDINPEYIERIKMEMDKFPAWHDDGIDMMSYLYDVLRDYRFDLEGQEMGKIEYPNLGCV